MLFYELKCMIDQHFLKTKRYRFGYLSYYLHNRVNYWSSPAGERKNSCTKLHSTQTGLNGFRFVLSLLHWSACNSKQNVRRSANTLIGFNESGSLCSEHGPACVNGLARGSGLCKWWEIIE